MPVEQLLCNDTFLFDQPYIVVIHHHYRCCCPSSSFLHLRIIIIMIDIACGPCCSCQKKKYARQLLTASIILPFHNEHFSTLLRSVYSVLNRAPKHLVHEVILADDYSSKGMFQCCVRISDHFGVSDEFVVSVTILVSVTNLWYR